MSESPRLLYTEPLEAEGSAVLEGKRVAVGTAGRG